MCVIALLLIWLRLIWTNSQTAIRRQWTVIERILAALLINRFDALGS